jgi:hypothetical protein
MTEENKTKKPRRKRRTKAQIEAEKAAALAAKSPIVDPKPQSTKEDPESPKEVKVDEVFVEMLEESVTLEEVAKEEPAESAKKPDSEKLPEYIPQTGMSKLRQKMMQRRLKDQYAQGNRQ